MATNAERLAEAYADAETWIMRLIAEAVRREAHGTATTYMARLSALRELIREVDQVFNTLDGAALSEVGGVLMDAWDDGVREAILTIPGEPAVPSGSITTLAIETAGALSSQRTAVLRSVQDGYREVIRDMAIRQSASGMSIDTAMQQALNKFAAKGITSFTDAAGRDWSMDTYTRMALRTATNRAANEARADSFRANDINLVIASAHPAPAPMCEPYQNQILSLDGMTGDRVVWDRVNDAELTVRVFATMDDAIRNGYHHPNCLHTDSAYIPGMPIPDPPEVDPGDYEAKQRQREMERHVKFWKRRKAVATSPQTERRANVKIRAWQGELRKHVGKHDFLSRQYQREQVRVGNPQNAV